MKIWENNFERKKMFSKKTKKNCKKDLANINIKLNTTNTRSKSKMNKQLSLWKL